MPETRYARSGDVNIAFQVVGEGPDDLVYIPGWISNIEIMWEDPPMAAFLERLASFTRLIIFDKRGTGMSDRVPSQHLPTLEVRMDDLRAVMDVVGSEGASLLGHSEGGNMAILFAATHPQRVDRLILVGSYAKRVWSEDYPWAPTPDTREDEVAELEEHWGEPGTMMELAPSRFDDPAFRGWMSRYARLGATPKDAVTLLRMNTQIDTRSVLPSISVPTLCIYKTADRDVNVEEGRWIVSVIPGAKLVEIGSRDHWIAGEGAEEVLDAIELFVTGHLPSRQPTRVLTTVLFTDIVGSTDTAQALGDSEWRGLLGRHREMVRTEIARFKGQEVVTTGDGFLARFDGPARAVRAARSIANGAVALGLEIRAGVHTGEVELVGDDIAGIAVHLGARIAGLGSPGEVLVSRTVRDLVAGSGLVFDDRGQHQLKGISEPWQVFAVVADSPGDLAGGAQVNSQALA
ncbi:MAG: adenylate/guanylate cyclase domain-containing protein [Actinobacteria bacterium]|nr:adenylate/guanylate cyclase domain-containing protein [Actinomycetota bacterium]